MTASCTRLWYATLLLALATVLTQPASAQRTVEPPEARSSPMRVAHTTLENGTYAKVVYGSPHKRGREIFGELVPYGEVWRLGANEATEVTFTGDVNFAGQPLEAGTYALFAIPGQQTWTMIVNNHLGQWGAYTYNEERDVLRVEVPAARIDSSYEAFTVSFEEADRGTDLVFAWDQTRVVVPIGVRVEVPNERASPLALARSRLANDTYVKVHYSSPRTRGREIFGALVPYGELWRTAANEGTEVTFTGPVRFGGQPVEAGTYTLLTIPGQQQWTVILSRQLGLNGTQGYDQARDAVRVQVPAQTTRATYEPFTIRFTGEENDRAMELLWDRTAVSVPIQAQ